MSCWRWSGVLALVLSTLACAKSAPVQAQAGTTALAPQALQAQGTIEAAFTPWDNIEALLLAEIVSAQHQVLMQALDPGAPAWRRGQFAGGRWSIEPERSDCAAPIAVCRYPGGTGNPLQECAQQGDCH